jgi:hypothetical protein
MNIILCILFVVMMLHNCIFSMESEHQPPAWKPQPTPCIMRKMRETTEIRTDNEISCSCIMSSYMRCQINWLFGSMMKVVISKEDTNNFKSLRKKFI